LRYTDKALLKQLPFTNISEKFRSKDFRYVIGFIKLETLLQNQDLLRASDAFLVSTGNFKSVETPTATAETNLQEENKLEEVL